MIYEFECPEHGRFEVNQPMMAEHKANCPICGKEAQRIFSSPQWFYDKPRNLFDKQGNYREDPFDTYKT